MTVISDQRGMRKFIQIFAAALSAQGGPENPLTEMFHQWASIYSTFIHRRFIQQSLGAGDWPDLADSTKKSRRGPGSRSARKLRIIATAKSKGVVLSKSEVRLKLIHSTLRLKKKKRGDILAGRKFSILVDTGQLRDAILPGNYGNLRQEFPGGIDVGFAPQAHASSRLSMGDLAAIHHLGLGRMPARTILVEPDDRAKRAMEFAARGIGVKIESMIGKGG